MFAAQKQPSSLRGHLPNRDRECEKQKKQQQPVAYARGFGKMGRYANGFSASR